MSAARLHHPRLSRRLLLAAPALLLPRAGHAQTATPLRVVSPWEYDSPDPVETGYILRRLNIAETLVGVRPDGQLTGLLAESWTVGEDGLTWRFRLRAARFHDGTPVTAPHVARVLERVWSQAESLSAIPLASMAAEGERDLVLRTRAPFSPLAGTLTDYAGVILAPSAYDAAGRPQRPVATGPYRVTGQQGTRGLTAEAFAGHWAGPPAIGAMAYTAAPLGETRASLAEAGEADLTFTLQAQAAQRIAAAGRARIHRVTLPRTRTVVMNLRRPQFADARVRRALSLATDREGMAAALLRHRESAAPQLLPPVLAEWHDPALPPLRRDPAEAARLLAEAGWQRGADGVLAREGQALRAVLMAPSNRPEMPVMAQALQAQWRPLGIAVEVRPGPSGSLPGAIQDGSLEAALTSRTYVNVPDPVCTLLPDFTGTRQLWSSPGFANAEMERLVPAYIASFDAAEKARLRRRMVALLQEELPVIPLSWTEEHVAVSPRLDPASVVLDPYEQSYGTAGLRWA
ncbi:ABC transporter substrate-binding protein [Roseomonas sp. GC11]|uniref:ABC transporter substrate-binding protein n=1 Tax=Roseomonas sp. GC11 TaxID=2950546 RepID=UPI00210B4297|nr:ABC transporter substrate-binding protein [Roseomonas sp. GC11]MCQ4162041.1 ABC transporter substrate-binding protein [Roseomonas sp. GC11]